ncbi:hypothetical protein HHI36_022730 [Cryptolaemus montrouzieri]|uniref:C2H2-type domain-containing protein n=1 Tax=Cryptolaemus montrouzieri TaxID=559131 RepID=A0ABD2N0N9_9CUCU
MRKTYLKIMDISTFEQYEEIDDINNVINIDGTQAIFMEGRFYIPANTQTILLPENDSRYILNDTGDILCNDNLETVLTKQKLPFIKNDKARGDLINIESLLENFNDKSRTEDDTEMKNYEYIVELENFEGLQDSQDSFLEHNSWNMSKNVEDAALKAMDVSKITGKNLLTGQTVTLDSYLEKIKNANRELTLKQAEEMSKTIRKKGPHTALTNLLNKKLTIGKTSTGRRLVGKVIHIGKKEADAEVSDGVPRLKSEVIEEGIPEQVEEDTCVLPIHGISEKESFERGITEDNHTNSTILIDSPDDLSTEIELSEDGNGTNEIMLEYVSRTLTNLMEMETVSKKLKRKNLCIKVTERVIKEEKLKVNVFQIRGHLELQGGFGEEEYEERWHFKLDEKGEGMWTNNKSFKKFLETMRISISIVQMDGVIQSTKVNLSCCQERCSLCPKQFRTIHKLKSHMKLVHHVIDNQFFCQLCDVSLENKDVFTKHRQYHVERKELFSCPHCDKHFLSETKMTKHMAAHDSINWKLTCSVCGAACSKMSSWRKHMLTHSGVKPYSCTQCFKQFATLCDLNYHVRVHDPKNCYVCKVCNRSFSRYSNLQRHSEIHGTKNSVSVFR